MSAIGWVDFSSDHREKVKTVIDLLGEPGVLDELGIGAIRDALSDAMFPGISTIQTRAKYFLTVPRIFQDYACLPLQDRRRTPLAEYLREHENRVMERLILHHGIESQSGIIGGTLYGTGKEVQRKPSSVYWTGLQKFGLVKGGVSLRDFLRKFASPTAALQDSFSATADSLGDDPEAGRQEAVGVRTAGGKPGWEERLTLLLNSDEAAFLSNQIEYHARDHLLGQVIIDPAIRTAFVTLPARRSFHAFCATAPFLTQLPPEVQRVVHAADDFWQLLQGAHIRYNVLLQSRFGTAERRAEFEEQWERWLTELRKFDWNRWDTGFVWKLARDSHRQIKPFTKHFVESWISRLRGASASGALPVSVGELDELVMRQERSNKSRKARLREGNDERVTEWIGFRSLDYRYPQARTIVEDIHAGLMRTGQDDA